VPSLSCPCDINSLSVALHVAPLRKSEYCVSSTFDPQRDLSLADLHFYPCVQKPLWVDVRIKAHKTDRVSAWQHKRLFMPSDPSGQALSAAYHLQLLAFHIRDTRPTSFKDPANTPLLRRKHGNVTYDYFKRTLKAHLSALGEDPSFLTSHSLRIGGATALLAAGASETTVKQAGRWLSSDMPQLYAHASTSSVQSFSDKMLTSHSLQADSRHHIFGWF
jgi:hypothetical protein